VERKLKQKWVPKDALAAEDASTQHLHQVESSGFLQAIDPI
jgi:hypothetical protein